MKIFSLLLFLIFFNISLNAKVFPIPEDNEVSFDVVRKNKIIGNLNIKFINDKENLILHSVLNIEVKILFIPAYKFFQETKETWNNGNFLSIDGFTDFEDDREYKIDGKDENGIFRATGMDGLLELDENILPLNYWNKQILKEKEVFYTQKGIVRKISVEKLKDEKIKINNSKIETGNLFLMLRKIQKIKVLFLNILWYKGDELLKMEFQPNDDKTVTIKK